MAATLYIRAKLSNGTRTYCPAVFASNRQLKPFFAVVKGNEERHPEGTYLPPPPPRQRVVVQIPSQWGTSTAMAFPTWLRQTAAVTP
jgi:hypothetical protein